MSDDEKQRRLATAVARVVDRNYSDSDRQALGEWLRRLLEIRNSDVPGRTKAREALKATDLSIAAPVVRLIAARGKQIIWSDRTWAARLGLGAAGAAALTVGGQNAGIAAMGGAIAVPLWIVLGAGGAFAGVLLQELTGTRAASTLKEPGSDELIVDAEWELVKEGSESATTFVDGAPDTADSSREPLRKVFMRTYRAARDRQREFTERVDKDRPGEQRQLPPN